MNITLHRSSTFYILDRSKGKWKIYLFLIISDIFSIRAIVKSNYFSLPVIYINEKKCEKKCSWKGIF